MGLKVPHQFTPAAVADMGTDQAQIKPLAAHNRHREVVGRGPLQHKSARRDLIQQERDFGEEIVIRVG